MLVSFVVLSRVSCFLRSLRSTIASRSRRREGCLYKIVAWGGQPRRGARFMGSICGGFSCWNRGGGKLILRCPAANWKISLKLPLFIREPLQPRLSVCPFVPFLAVNSIRITRARISLPPSERQGFSICPPFRRLGIAQLANVLISNPREFHRCVSR